MLIEFRLLGDIEVIVDGDVVEVGHARQRCVLAALLIDVNRVVATDQLLDRVWAGELPQRARAALSSYVSRLRRVLPDVSGLDIRSQSGGYVLEADPLTVDLYLFRDLIRRARAAGDPAVARDLFGRALELWRGPAMHPLDTPWISGGGNPLRQNGSRPNSTVTTCCSPRAGMPPC